MFNQRCSKEVIYCRSKMGFGWFWAGLEFSCVVLGDSECLWRHLGSYWVRAGGVLGWFWRPLERILVRKKVFLVVLNVVFKVESCAILSFGC